MTIEVHPADLEGLVIRWQTEATRQRRVEANPEFAGGLQTAADDLKGLLNRRAVWEATCRCGERYTGTDLGEWWADHQQPGDEKGVHREMRVRVRYFDD